MMEFVEGVGMVVIGLIALSQGKSRDGSAK